MYVLPNILCLSLEPRFLTNKNFNTWWFSSSFHRCRPKWSIFEIMTLQFVRLVGSNWTSSFWPNDQTSSLNLPCVWVRHAIYSSSLKSVSISFCGGKRNVWKENPPLKLTYGKAISCQNKHTKQNQWYTCISGGKHLKTLMKWTNQTVILV